MSGKSSGAPGPTVLGILAILFWGSNIAFSRSLTEQLGTLTAATWTFAVGGGAAMIHLLFQRDGLAKTLRLPRRYILGCGAVFVPYMVCLYLAIGLATSREQVIEIGIINYLWPSLTLALAVPMLRRRAHLLLLVPGIALAFGGIVLIMAGGNSVSWQGFLEHLGANAAPYALALVAAVLWALYSNLIRRWAADAEGWVIPLFLLASALAVFPLRMMVAETTHWTPRAALELLYMGLFPTWLGYAFWDVAMRRGNIILVVTLSYFIPVLSTAISGLYLRVHLGLTLWLACAMIVAGAFVCKWALPGE